MTITGKHLLELGFEQGPEFATALAHVNEHGLTGDALAQWVAANKPAPRVGQQGYPGSVVKVIADDPVMNRSCLMPVGWNMAGFCARTAYELVNARALNVERERAT